MLFRCSRETSVNRPCPGARFVTCYLSSYTSVIFQKEAAKARVAVEHAFGILKGRRTILRNARWRVQTKKDEALAHGMIQCCFILHNLCLRSWELFLDREEMERLARQEALPRNHSIVTESRYDGIREAYRRQERLVDQIVELDDELGDEWIDIIDQG
jgi:hypothetical protein